MFKPNILYRTVGTLVTRGVRCMTCATNADKKSKLHPGHGGYFFRPPVLPEAGKNLNF
jgi:hypothetical protein